MSFQLWSLALWGGKVKEETQNISNSNSNSDNGLEVREIESVRFPLKETRMSSSSSSKDKIKKKWHSRQERKNEKEHVNGDVDDVVLVPNVADGVSLSGEDSDWSIGWLEPHAPDFLSDDETDDSFAVLVPCYRNRNRNHTIDVPHTHLLNTINNLTSDPFTEGKNLMDQWLSSLQNF